MKKLALFAVVSFLLLTGCPPPTPARIGNVVEYSLVGSADDADPNTKPQPANYHSANVNPGPTKAEDGPTKADSDAAKSNTLGGSAHAEPGPQPKGADAAIAKSLNHVVTEFVVDAKGAYKFEFNLDAQGVKIVGLGKLTLVGKANVLDANGKTMLDAKGQPRSDTNLLDKSYEVSESNGKTQAIDNTDPQHTGAPEAVNKGSYTKKLDGPAGGTMLDPGKYRIELDLRIIATASVAGTPKAVASVDHATLTATLK